MSNLSEVKNNIISLVLTKKNGETNLLELEKLYKNQIGDDLHKIAVSNGHKSVCDMIQNWNEFSVFKSFLHTTIKVKRTNHITELNQRSKLVKIH